MENGKDWDALRNYESVSMEPLDQRNRAMSHNDIMSRRLKNRERQRRYRARKRVEADTKKASSTMEQPNDCNPLQIELQINEAHINNSAGRVYRKRNWKKDARMKHALRKQDGVETELGSTLENKLQSENSVNLGVGIKLGRRNWKAEARKKVS